MSNRVNVFKTYFTYHKLTNTSKCNIKQCTECITGYHSGNLSRHIKRKHPEIYEEILAMKTANDDKAYQKWVCVDEPAKVIKKKIDQECSSTQKKFVMVQMLEEDFWKGIMDLVIKNGNSPSLFDLSGFRKILDPICEGFDSSVQVNSKLVMKRISELSRKYRGEIQEAVKNKVIFLKIDATACSDRKIVAINVQFADDFQIRLKNLGVVEVVEYTPDIIKAAILRKLEEYQIHVNQVLSITTDCSQNTNGNITVLKRGENNERNHEEMTPESDDEFDDDSSSRFNDSFGVNNHGTIPVIYDNYIELSKDGFKISSKRCVADFGAFVSKNITDDSALSEKIAKVRSIVEKLRTPLYANDLKSCNLKKAKVDDDGCWSSTFEMLKRFNWLREFVIDLGKEDEDLVLGEDDWKFVEEYLKVFECLSKFMIKVQEENFLFGDFFLSWLEMKLSVEKIRSKYSFALLFKALVERYESNFLENDMFCASIFMDPRVHFLLAETQKYKAKSFLKKLCSNVKIIRGLEDPVTCEKNTSSTLVDSVKTEDDLLEHYLASQAASTARNSDAMDPINSIIDHYSSDRQSKNFDVMQYWKQKHSEMPLFAELASIVLAAPCTKFSMEANYSYLKFLSTEHYDSLYKHTLEDIMILRINDRFSSK